MITATLSAMLTTLVSWFIIGSVLLGVGLIIRNPIREQTCGCRDLFRYAWCGYAMLLALLQVWQVFWPVDGYAGGLVLFLALTGYVRNHGLLSTVCARMRRLDKINLVLIGICLLVLSNWAIGAPQVYDTGLYHLNTLLWWSSHPLVPGITNLHDRLGYANSHFLLGALLEGTLWRGFAYHVCNSSLLVLLFLELLANAFSQGMFYRRIWGWMGLVCFILELPYFRSVSPHSVILILQLQCCLLVMQLTMDKEYQSNTTVVCQLLLLAFAGITAKLSFLITGMSLVVLAVWYSRGCIGNDNIAAAITKKKTAIRGMIIGACFILPWIMRNIIMSGCLLFPVAATRLPLDWAVPSADIEWARIVVHGWARMPGGDFVRAASGWGWLPTWIHVSLLGKYGILYIVLPCAFLVIFTVLWLTIEWKSINLNTEMLERLFSNLLPWITGAIFWFWAAPAPRFAAGNFWCLLIAGIAAIRFSGWGNARRVFSLLLMRVAVIILFVLVIMLKPHYFYVDVNGYYRLPDVKYEKVITKSGMILQRPTSSGMAWYGTFNSTPMPNPWLELRDRNDMRRGFRAKKARHGCHAFPNREP